MTIDYEKTTLEELDKTILSLINFRKYLAKKVGEKKRIHSMSKFLAMLRKEVPSFRAIVNELEKYRQQNLCNGVVVNAGLHGTEDPPIHVWWTTVKPIDDLIGEVADITRLVEILSHETRLHILKLLTSGNKTYKELAAHLDIKGGAFAHHAKPLLMMKCISKIGRGNYQITELGWQVLCTILSLSKHMNENSLL